jgi:hypothetical protein
MRKIKMGEAKELKIEGAKKVELKWRDLWPGSMG